MTELKIAHPVHQPSRIRMLLEHRASNIFRMLQSRVPKQYTRRLLNLSPPGLRDYQRCKLRVYPKGNYTEGRLWTKGRPPEHGATVFLCKLFEGTAPVIVDVGANAGIFSLPILKAGTPDARLLAFEPNPVMFKRLAINTVLNGFENAHLFDCAVGDEVGEAPLFYPRNFNFGQGRVGIAYRNNKNGKGVTVQIRPLLECLEEAEVEQVDFLKVDVEGLEDRVIAPILTGPEKFRPKALYFEDAHDQFWIYPLTELLANAGYGKPKRFKHNVFYLLGADA